MSKVDSGIRVVDAMTVQPVVAGPHATIRDVAELMDRYKVGSVLIKQNDALLGIVTENDFVCRVVLEGYDPATPITRVMTRDIITISPGADLFDALLLMKDAEIKHLPVIDDGKHVGFITVKDILRIQPQLFEVFVEVFKLREEDRKPLGTIRPLQRVRQPKE